MRFEEFIDGRPIRALLMRGLTAGVLLGLGGCLAHRPALPAGHEGAAESVFDFGVELNECALESERGIDVMRRWRDRDRIGLLRWLGNSYPDVRYAMAESVAGWAVDDLAGAVDYLSAMSGSGWKSRLVDAVALDAVNAGWPQSALVLLVRFPGSSQAEIIRMTALGNLAELEVGALEKWLADEARSAEAVLAARVAAAPHAGGSTSGEVESITLADLADLVDSGDGLVFDARSVVANRAGHVPGALHWPANYFEGGCLSHAAVLGGGKAGRRIVVYCDDGGCGASERVARELRRLGHGRVAIFADGWAGWEQAGLPVERTGDDGARVWTGNAEPGRRDE